MTSREKLRILVERLTESEATVLLAQLEELQPSAPNPLSFAGIGRSGHSDASERSEEILRAELPSR